MVWMKIYSFSLNDLEQILFEVSDSFMVVRGPFCMCGNFCELEVDPKCTEFFIEMPAIARDKVIRHVKELKLEDVKIVEHTESYKVHTANET